MSPPAPVCDAEADLNADGSLDIVDITCFVRYLFSDGVPPASCN